MKKSVWPAALLVCALVVMLLVFIPGCGKDEVEGNVIRIGITGPMGYVPGDHHWFGAEMARDEINAAGGIQVGEETYNIQLVEIDTNEVFSVDDAVNAVEREIGNVDFLMGGFRTEAVTPYTAIIAEHQKIFIICGAATNALLEGRVDEDYDTWKYLFRVTPLKSTILAQISFLQLVDVVTLIRTEYGIATPKVAILAEQLEWNEVMVQIAEGFIEAPLGAEHVGTWRPSATATELTAELEAIRSAGAHVIFTINSGPLGVPFGRDYGRLEIPAAAVGITVEAQSSDYLDATDGYGEYVATINTLARINITESTLEFFDRFVAKTGQVPIYTVGTYDAIHILKEAIERAGTLDTDALIGELEKTEYLGNVGKIQFDENHDVIWGPGNVTGIGTQWVDGELKAFWPHSWRPDPANHPDLVISYPGTVPFQFPPWFVEHWTAE